MYVFIYELYYELLKSMAFFHTTRAELNSCNYTETGWSTKPEIFLSLHKKCANF